MRTKTINLNKLKMVTSRMFSISLKALRKIMAEYFQVSAVFIRTT